MTSIGEIGGSKSPSSWAVLINKRNKMRRGASTPLDSIFNSSAGSDEPRLGVFGVVVSGLPSHRAVRPSQPPRRRERDLIGVRSSLSDNDHMRQSLTNTQS